MNKMVSMLIGSGKAVLFAASMTVFAPAHATVIIDHSNGGAINGTTWSNSGGTNWTVWDDFSLASEATVDGITYFTANLRPDFTRDYTLKIGTSAGQSNVFSTIIANSAATHTKGVVTASFAPLTLSPGTYWLTFNGLDNLFGSAAVPGASLNQMINGTSNIRGNAASSFILTKSTSVPEPGSLALLGLGLLGFVAARRKSSK